MGPQCKLEEDVINVYSNLVNNTEILSCTINDIIHYPSRRSIDDSGAETNSALRHRLILFTSHGLQGHHLIVQVRTKHYGHTKNNTLN
jgi:hypothetical protein